MIRIRQMRLVTYLAVVLLIAMYIAPAALAAKKVSSKPVTQPAKTIIVFPFEDSSEGAPESLSNDLAQSIQATIGADGAFRAIAFSTQLPSIKRARLETALTDADLKGPFGIEKAQMASAIKIANQTAVDMLLVGTIDEVAADTESKTASATMTAILADANTGAPVKTIAVTGTVPEGATGETESELIAFAAGDAVTKIVNEISPLGIQVASSEPALATGPVVARSSKKKSGISKFIIPIVIAVVALAVSSDSDDEVDDDLDDPPWHPL